MKKQFTIWIACLVVFGLLLPSGASANDSATSEATITFLPNPEVTNIIAFNDHADGVDVSMPIINQDLSVQAKIATGNKNNKLAVHVGPHAEPLTSEAVLILNESYKGIVPLRYSGTIHQEDPLFNFTRKDAPDVMVSYTTVIGP